jgi:hypothetical protein
VDANPANTVASLLTLRAEGASLADINAFAGATISNTDSNPTDGSAATYTLDVADGGGSLSFNWNFTDAEVSNNNDFAFVVIDGVVTTLEASVSEDVNGNTVFNIALSAGVHTVTFGVMNSDDNNSDSSLTIDSIVGATLTNFEKIGSASGGEIVVTENIVAETDGSETIYQGTLALALDIDTTNTHTFQIDQANVSIASVSAAAIPTVTVTDAAAGTYDIVGNFDALAEGETATVTFEYTAQVQTTNQQ